GTLALLRARADPRSRPATRDVSATRRGPAGPAPSRAAGRRAAGARIAGAGGRPIPCGARHLLRAPRLRSVPAARPRMVRARDVEALARARAAPVRVARQR